MKSVAIFLSATGSPVWSISLALKPKIASSAWLSFALAALYGASASATTAAVAFQALLPAGAVGAGVAAGAVVAERALTGIRRGLLSIAPFRLPLVLVEIATARLVLVCSRAVLL